MNSTIISNFLSTKQSKANMIEMAMQLVTVSDLRLVIKEIADKNNKARGRAAWLLDTSYDIDNSNHHLVEKEIIDILKNNTNYTVGRSLLRIIANLNESTIIDKSAILIIALDNFEDVNIPIANRIHALHIIEKIGNVHPEIMDVVEEQIDLEIQQYQLSSGLQSRFKRFKQKRNVSA